MANGLCNAKEMEHQISGALLQFARTGNPNGEDLLNWPEYTLHDRSTLILDDQPRIGKAFDHVLHELYVQWLAGQNSPLSMKKDDKITDIT